MSAKWKIMNTDRTQFTSRYCLKCRPSDTEFLADCQKILAGSGYWLRKRARFDTSKQYFNPIF